MSEPEISRHPLPWKRGAGGWVRMAANPHEEYGEDGRLIELLVGGGKDELSRADVAELHRQLGDILNAPYRLIVAGGDAVPEDKLPTIAPWLDRLRRNVIRHGWRMQVVNGHANNAQAAVTAWCVDRDVEILKQRTLDFSVGGNAVALLPSASASLIVHVANGEYCLPVYWAGGNEMWGDRR